MARRRLEPGELGDISCTKQPTGKWRARVRYRDQTGVMRTSEVTHDSKTKAVDLLRDKATELANTIPGDLTLNSPMADLIASWWETEKDRHTNGRISASTLAVYEGFKDRIESGLQSLRVREVTVARLQNFVRTEGEGHPSVQVDLKRLLVAIFKHAAGMDVLKHNPAESISVQSPPRKDIEALNEDDVHELRRIVRAYEDASGSKGGRPRAIYLSDLVDLMLSTGCRISEMLGLRWEDVDLVAKTITVVGVVKIRKANPAKGITSLYWQAKGKTPAAWRTIPLGEVALDILLRRHVNNDKGHPYVFSSLSGTLRSPNNVRTALRKATDEAASTLPASRTHILRKTVATVVEEREGLRTASLLLGHKTTATTERHYVKRPALAPDASTVLDDLLTNGG